MDIRAKSLLVSCLAALAGPPALAYEVQAVENGGAIEGVVRYNGKVEMRRVIPTKDISICGAPREDPLITVGAGNAVESAVVYLVGIQSGKGGRRGRRRRC